MDHRLAFLYGWKCFLIMDPGITAALADRLCRLRGLHPSARRRGAPRGGDACASSSLAVVHILGLRVGTRIVTALTALKVALILATDRHRAGSVRQRRLAELRPPGLTTLDRAPLGPAIATALMSAFFAFGGWWEVTKMSGEVRDPERTMPRALVLGLAAVTLIYMLITLAFMYVVPIEQVGAGEAFVSQVGTALLGPSGAIAVTLVVLACILRAALGS